MVTLMLEGCRTMGEIPKPHGCFYMALKILPSNWNIADAWKALAGMAFCVRAVELATRN
jgi:hypothetical protein